MTDPLNLKNHFLIAMPSMSDPHFSKSVTLICEHNEEGAMGIVINHDAGVSTSELLEHLEIQVQDNFFERPVVAGGPVQVDRGFVIHSSHQDWQSSLNLDHSITITTSLDILEAIASSHELNNAIVALGYAGWGPGQLEAEIAENAWLTVPVSPEILFATDISKRWQKATELLGVDIEQLASFGGHA